MSKLLLLLLFIFVQNLTYNNLTVYDSDRLEKLMGNVATLNVNEGDEFYIRFIVNPSILMDWTFLNSNEFSGALQSMGYSTERRGGWRVLGAGAYRYYKFKALKPSINQIALKFQQSIRISNEINDLVIKINILKKDQTS